MLSRFLVVFFVMQLCTLCPGQAQASVEQSGVEAPLQVQRSMTLMGSRFAVTVVARDSTVANKQIDVAVAEMERIENLISEWRPGTLVSEINRQAGIRPVKVTKELFDLTRRALFFSAQSDGAFDISTAAMDKIWYFDGRMDTLPDAEAVKRSVALVDYRKIVLDSLQQTIFLKEKGMKIGFGSIGKGYAADKARQLLQESGVLAGLIDASGDIAVWGAQANGKPWAIGVFNPFKPGEMAKVLHFKWGAVTTSGSYQKYAEIAGVRYAHIINPKTGYPTTGLVSVTVYGPSAEFANGLSTSMMVLGREKALALIKRFPDYKAVLISDKGQLIY